MPKVSREKQTMRLIFASYSHNCWPFINVTLCCPTHPLVSPAAECWAEQCNSVSWWWHDVQPETDSFSLRRGRASPGDAFFSFLFSFIRCATVTYRAYSWTYSKETNNYHHVGWSTSIHVQEQKLCQGHQQSLDTFNFWKLLKMQLINVVI